MHNDTLNVTFSVLIPLIGILILSGLLFLVIYKFRGCRKKKRGKNSAVVKASEGIHLLDKINVVNKNPTYFVPNAEGQFIKTDVLDIPAKDIRLLEVIGEGAFGQVYKGMYTKQNKCSNMNAYQCSRTHKFRHNSNFNRLNTKK